MIGLKPKPLVPATRPIRSRNPFFRRTVTLLCQSYTEAYAKAHQVCNLNQGKSSSIWFLCQDSLEMSPFSVVERRCGHRARNPGLHVLTTLPPRIGRA